MNLRTTFLIGALSVAGFVATACGPAKECNTSNCTGCCDSNNECQTGSADTACGINGASCSACSGAQICQAGACVPTVGNQDSGTDAGTKDAGTMDSGTTDAGTTDAGTTDAGMTDAGTTDAGTTDAGTTDAGTTDAGTTDAGMPDAGSAAALGSPCTSDSQCSDEYCLDQATYGFPGGYCTSDCSNGESCGAGNSCAFGEVCIENCATPGGGQLNCRANYVCDKFVVPGAENQGVCLGGCATDNDCGSGVRCDTATSYCCGDPFYKCCSTGAACKDGQACGADGYCPQKAPITDLGAACTADTGCQGELCLGPSDGFPAAGFCSAECNANSECPTGSSCAGACLSNCAAPGSQSTCPAGLVCDKFWVDPPTQGTCVPACVTNADCGNGPLCDTNGLCCGDSSYACCSTGQACLDGSACGADGYCP